MLVENTFAKFAHSPDVSSPVVGSDEIEIHTVTEFTLDPDVFANPALEGLRINFSHTKPCQLSPDWFRQHEGRSDV
jgi:hypothetical protein